MTALLRGKLWDVFSALNDDKLDSIVGFAYLTSSLGLSDLSMISSGLFGAAL